MDLRKFGNFNWRLEMDSKDQNLDLTRTKRIYFCPFQSIFMCWDTTRILRYLTFTCAARISGLGVSMH